MIIANRQGIQGWFGGWGKRVRDWSDNVVLGSTPTSSIILTLAVQKKKSDDTHIIYNNSIYNKYIKCWLIGFANSNPNYMF